MGGGAALIGSAGLWLAAPCFPLFGGLGGRRSGGPGRVPHALDTER